MPTILLQHPALVAALLLTASNLFMTFAWYGAPAQHAGPRLVDRRAGELGHRAVRIPAAGAGQPHRLHGAVARAAQDHAGSDHAAGVRAVRLPLHGPAAEARLSSGRGCAWWAPSTSCSARDRAARPAGKRSTERRRRQSRRRARQLSRRAQALARAGRSALQRRRPARAQGRTGRRGKKPRRSAAAQALVGAGLSRARPPLFPAGALRRRRALVRPRGHAFARFGRGLVQPGDVARPAAALGRRAAAAQGSARDSRRTTRTSGSRCADICCCSSAKRKLSTIFAASSRTRHCRHASSPPGCCRRESLPEPITRPNICRWRSIGRTSRGRGRTRPSRSRRRSISTSRANSCCASTRRTIASARPSADRSPISPRRCSAGDAGRQIRIGYLSADFRSHVMGRLMLEVVRRHDTERFSVHAYSLAVREIEDEVTAQFRACCAGFRRLDDVDDASAARLIADDGIDILIDLMGHSGSSRPAILLYKPAPVIITHLGNHGAVGMRQVDFKLTDAHADLPDAHRYQIEAPLALDRCVLPFRRVAAAPEAPVTRAESGAGRGGDGIRRLRQPLEALAALPRPVEADSRRGPGQRAGIFADEDNAARAVSAAAGKLRHRGRAHRIRSLGARRCDRSRALPAGRRRPRHAALHRRRHDRGCARHGRPGRHPRRRAAGGADDVQPARASRRHRRPSRTTTTITWRSPAGSRATGPGAMRSRRKSSRRCRRSGLADADRYTRSLESAYERALALKSRKPG